jgi:phospholipase C
MKKNSTLTNPLSVPAFLISPFIPANTLIHNEGTSYAKNSAYTHTSVLHFLQELWELEGLNNRVQWAKTFEYVFSGTSRDDTPKTLTTPTWEGGSGQPEPSPFYLLNQDYSYYAAQ